MAKCIISPTVNRKIKEALQKGTLKVEDLLANGSDYRIKQFEKIAGKNVAEQINKRFISKFETELSPEVLDDIFKSFSKIEKLKLQEGLSATNTPEWAKEYVKLNRRIEDVVSNQKTMGIMSTLKEGVQRVKDQQGITGQIGQGAKELTKLVTAPVYKSIKASLDASFALRQGFKVLTQSPTQYKKSILEAFSVFKQVRSKEAMDAIIDDFKAKLISHPNYDKLVNEGKLAVGVVEDFFPTSIAEKIPGLGNIFKSSNEAFTIFSQGARFGIANDLLEKGTQLAGRELNKDEVKAIAQIANSITGRGSLGKFESSSKFLNDLFFSARYIRSQVDTFINPFNPKLDAFTRKESLKHATKTLGTIGALMATASMFGEVEFDPRSSHFGKVRVGNTDKWIDLTAGLGSYVVLATRQAKGETKGLNGKLTKLNSGKYRSRTRGDVLADWASGKLAPAPSVLKQVFLDGKLYGGEKVTAGGVAKQLIAPISANNAYDYLTEEDLSTALLLSGADALGLGTGK